ncbi:MAG: hypothetical protein ACJ72N_11690 [Labedaea sp.]
MSNGGAPRNRQAGNGDEAPQFDDEHGRAEGTAPVWAVNAHILPRDTAWPQENRLMAELSQVNTEIARYIFNLLDVDAGRAMAVCADDERKLGLKLATLGERVQLRAAKREVPANGGVIEGDSAQPLQFDPSYQPQTDADS